MRSHLKWFGGKHYLVKHILPFPEHDVYVELFGGSAAVLLKKEPADREVYNDINDRLVNHWLCLREYCEELKYLCGLKGELFSRTLFERYKDHADDPLEDAFRFLYVNRHSYSGMNETMVGKDGNTTSHHGAYLNVIERLDEIANRIKYIRFENQDFRRLFRRYNEPNVMWYIDPPYFEGGQEYESGIGGKKWTDKDQSDLYDLLLKCKGNFALSIDNKNFYDRDDWYYQEVERFNFSGSIMKKEKKSKSIEYIIRNYDPKEIVPQNHKNITIDKFFS